MGVPFPANLSRFDPYKTYAFLVYFGDSPTPVAGVSKVSALTQTSAVADYNSGGDAITRKGLGRTTYADITLERGVTHDTDFETWAKAAQALDHGVPSQSLKKLRKNLIIVVMNEARQPVLRYFVYRAFVSEYRALPDLDGGTSGIAIESIKLVNEGWERDLSLAMPPEN
jgi:phage tail-like protein